MQPRPDMATPHLESAGAVVADEAEKGRLLRARANLAWETGDIPAARRLAQQARDIAMASGTPDDVAAAFEQDAHLTPPRRAAQLTYSSAIARASSRIAIPESTSSRVIVSGGTAMTTFQCVIR